MKRTYIKSVKLQILNCYPCFPIIKTDILILCLLINIYKYFYLIYTSLKRKNDDNGMFLMFYNSGHWKRNDNEERLSSEPEERSQRSRERCKIALWWKQSKSSTHDSSFRLWFKFCRYSILWIFMVKKCCFIVMLIHWMVSLCWPLNWKLNYISWFHGLVQPKK